MIWLLFTAAKPTTRSGSSSRAGQAGCALPPGGREGVVARPGGQAGHALAPGGHDFRQELPATDILARPRLPGCWCRAGAFIAWSSASWPSWLLPAADVLLRGSVHPD
jgi:hypothetical protein